MSDGSSAVGGRRTILAHRIASGALGFFQKISYGKTPDPAEAEMGRAKAATRITRTHHMAVLHILACL
jgi:hypothetical protein